MFDRLMSASIQGGIVILVLLIALRIFPSVPPKARVWLWRIVFAKLAISLLPISAIPLNVLQPVATPVAQMETFDASATAPVPEPTQPSTAGWYFAWGAGVAVASVLMLRRVANVREALAIARPETDPIPLTEVAQLAMIARLKETPRLLLSEDAPTALVAGLRKPSILLPVEMRESEDRRLVLAHETSHIAHRDLHWNVLFSAVRILFFFHPLVWLAARAANQAQEAAADAAAVRLCNASPKRYAEMLLRATLFSPSAFPSFSAGLPLGGSTVNIRHRLQDLRFVNAKLSLSRIAIVTVLSCCVVALTPAYQLASRHEVQTASVTQTKASATKHSIKRHAVKRNTSRSNRESGTIHVSRDGKDYVVTYGKASGSGKGKGVTKRYHVAPGQTIHVGQAGSVKGVSFTAEPDVAGSAVYGVTTATAAEVPGEPAYEVTTDAPEAAAVTGQAGAVSVREIAAPARVVTTQGLSAAAGHPAFRGVTVRGIASAPVRGTVRATTVRGIAAPNIATVSGVSIAAASAPLSAPAVEIQGQLAVPTTDISVAGEPATIRVAPVAAATIHTSTAVGVTAHVISTPAVAVEEVPVINQSINGVKIGVAKGQAISVRSVTGVSVRQSTKGRGVSVSRGKGKSRGRASSNGHGSSAGSGSSNGHGSSSSAGASASSNGQGSSSGSSSSNGSGSSSNSN